MSFLQNKPSYQDKIDQFSDKRYKENSVKTHTPRKIHTFETNINGLKGPSVNVEHLEDLILHKTSRLGKKLLSA